MKCKKCDNRFDETMFSFWDEGSSYGSVKVAKCPECGWGKPIKYKYDRWFINESVCSFKLKQKKIAEEVLSKVN